MSGTAVTEKRWKDGEVHGGFSAGWKLVDWMGRRVAGANTQGRTLEEARENLQEAVRLVIDANREVARRETEGKSVVREELTVVM